MRATTTIIRKQRFKPRGRDEALVKFLEQMENSGRTATETPAIHTVSAMETAATVVAKGDGAIAISSPPVEAKGDNAIPISSSPVERKRQKGVSTEDTIVYQRREIGKELLLLEKHLQQGCKTQERKAVSLWPIFGFGIFCGIDKTTKEDWDFYYCGKYSPSKPTMPKKYLK